MTPTQNAPQSPSEPLGDVFLDTVWSNAFLGQMREQEKFSGQSADVWRAGGRATKDNPDKENGKWWAVSGREMLQRWVDWRNGSHGWKIWRNEGIPAIELGLIVNFGDVPVKMHIDRVMVTPAGELVILDLKTGQRTPSSDLQLAFYAVGMELALGIRPQYGTYWMARSGTTSALVDLDFYTKEMIIDMVAQFDKARKAHLFIPNLNNCKMCDLTEHCQYFKKEETV
jgi:hypothetical protein